jgi:hypothetical protein
LQISPTNTQTFADYPNLLDLQTFRKCDNAIFGFGISGFAIRFPISLADLKLDGGLEKTEFFSLQV